MSVLPRPSQSTYNVRVESLRGVAALVVAAAHVGQVPAIVDGSGQNVDLSLITDPNGVFWDCARYAYHWTTRAEGAVVLFFVISGYVLRLSLDRMRDRQTSRIAANFLLRRVLRLFPPVAFMVAVFATFSAFGYGYPSSQLSLGSLVRHALLLDYAMNGVVWTLQAELIAAPLILICWYVLSRWGPWPVVAIGAVLCVAGFDGHYNDLLLTAWPGLAPVGVVSFLFAFVFGMLVVEWAQLVQIAGLHRLRRWWLPVGIVLICAAPDITFHMRLVIDVLGAIALLSAVVCGFSPFGNAVLGMSAIRFLGRTSYSFYLMHPLTVPFLFGTSLWVSALLNSGLPAVVILLVLLSASVLVALPLTVLSYLVAEKPSMALARMLGSTRPTDAAHMPTEGLG